jgi:O-antigen ligase
LNLNLWEKAKTAFWSSDHAFNRPLFLSLIFLLPTQFGRHFWLSFSYLHGLRLDYLSLVFYVTDLLFLLLFIQFFFQKRQIIFSFLAQLFSRSVSLLGNSIKASYLCFGIVLYVVSNLLFSQSPWLSLYGWIKMGEIVLFTGYTYLFCRNKLRAILCIRFFLLGVLLQSFLAVWQYHLGGSVGGLWYFLGERLYSGNTPGIANASIFGTLVLRPYATLPHPNVLAAYLLVAVYLLLHTKNLFPNNVRLGFTIFFTALFSGTLLLTLSRIALLLLIPLLFVSLLTYVSKRTAALLVIVGIAVVIILFPYLLGRFGSLSLQDESVISREFYFQSSLKIIRAYPLLGTGLFAYLPTLGKNNSVISYDLLQPVHSVPMLITSELGIPFFLLLVAIVGYGAYLYVKERRFSSLLLLILILSLSLFDHYFWTLQQGQLLLGFSLSMIFIQALNRPKKIEKTRISNTKKRKI